ncbi:hypothetical protein Peur_058584 [Populus x canadensis]
MAAAAPMSGPTVFFVKPWAIQSVQTHRQPILPISPALPIPTLPPAQICAADLSRRWHGCHRPDIQTSSPLRQALDCPVPRSRERCRIAPCSSKNLRCRFSPTNLQLHKSALPILPPLGMAAAAPMSGPTVFFVKPWAIQSVQTHRQPILPISPALPIPTLPRVQTSIVSSALPLTILTL